MPPAPVSIHADSEDSATLNTGLGAMAEQASSQLQNAGKIVETLVTNRPALALGAALTAGVLLGCLIKRR